MVVSSELYTFTIIVFASFAEPSKLAKPLTLNEPHSAVQYIIDRCSATLVRAIKLIANVSWRGKAQIDNECIRFGPTVLNRADGHVLLSSARSQTALTKSGRFPLIIAARY